MQDKLAELKRQLVKGSISRRDFAKAVALLGVSLGAGEFLAACTPTAAPSVTPSPTYPFGGEVDYNAITAVDIENNNPDELLQFDELVTPPVEPTSQPIPTSTPGAKRNILWRCDVCAEMLQLKIS